MARNSTPATRAYARDKAEVIGAAERVIYGEIRAHWATPAVVVVTFFGFIGWAVGLVESINL